MRRQLPLWKPLRFLFRCIWSLFCCGNGRNEQHDREHMMERLQHDNSGYHHVAQEAQFKTMKKPSFTLHRSGTHGSVPASVDDEVCLICLEEFTDSNPKVFYECSHGFHLGCMLEWQERGKTDCPVCDLSIVGPDDI